ncbi:hypothetical protein V1527DRAFT_454124 [Lipomyces starkeyi]
MAKPLEVARATREESSYGAEAHRFDLDEHYETHEEFVEQVSTFLEQHDKHEYDASLQTLKIRATLEPTFLIDNDISMGACALTADRIYRKKLQCCSGMIYSTVLAQKEYFKCRGELYISFSKANESGTIIYEHIGHTESQKFHMTQEVQKYIKANKRLPPRQIYQYLIQMTNEPQFETTEVHTITRPQVYNFWLSLTKSEWQRDAADDFRSAQLLVAKQQGFESISGLEGPGISLAFATRCFTDRQKFDHTKMTEVFIDSTFGTNKHGFELYCVLTEYDLVSLPLSYLLLDTRGLQENGKRGSMLTEWFTALRNAGLQPNVVHTDKDFTGIKPLEYFTLTPSGF